MWTLIITLLIGIFLSAVFSYKIFRENAKWEEIEYNYKKDLKEYDERKTIIRKRLYYNYGTERDKD
jgi:hypothetical protein